MHSVLIVDDLRENQQLLRLFFTANRYQVTTASRGEEAITLAGLESFDVALVDWQMPGMNGLEVCRALLALSARKHHALGAWLMTGADPQSVHAAAFAAGCRGVFDKPLRFQEILDTIGRYLATRGAVA